MAKIIDVFPEYGTTSKLDLLRSTEYGYLDEQNHVYLDYTGAGLASRAQFRAQQERLSCTTFGNPHSTNPTSQPATDLIEKTRKRILAHFNASPETYAVIFTPNASGAARLVGESYPFGKRSRLVLTSDNHNSINGLREFAKRRSSRTVYVPSKTPDHRVDDADIQAALPRRSNGGCLPPFSTKHRSLFAYPAQSNFTGVRHPLSWVSLAQQRGYDVLLDAAAYVPTNNLDLSNVQPEFVTVSWYKLFGFPTGVGCLIARHDALKRLSRPWFSGGTVQAVSTAIPWYVLMGDETAFEDGTLNFLSIPDVAVGLDWVSGIGMDVISTRVRCLTGWLLLQLQALRHSDNSPMVLIYGPTDAEGRGGTVCLNFLDAAGKIVDERIVAMESAEANISLRTGCFCNPGAGEAALGISEKTLKPLIRTRWKNLRDFLTAMDIPATGAIRVSVGVASTTADVDRFISFAKDAYQDRVVSTKHLLPRLEC